MKDRVFVDSNVLIYAHDLDARDKHLRAVEVVRGLWENRNGILSTQVLQEFYVNVTRKIPEPLPRSKAREVARNYSLWQTETIHPVDVFRASEIEETNQISFWDALIVVTATKGGASTLLSEDLSAGQIIAGVAIENPFAD
ncbi:MAG: PIN domain-containing protein [Acidobacteria bacterium]|nr:PIN domain-containing protein [Acidobacteriota bacterium]